MTLTVTDDQGASDSTIQSVTVNDGSSSNISLSASGYKVRGVHHADLTWSGSNGGSIDIYRNGALIATVADSGSYTDNTGNKGGGASYTYQVCDSSACSNNATVNF